MTESHPDHSTTGPKGKQGRTYKARKVPVSFTVEPELLASFDAQAEALGVSRAALLALAMGRVVRDGA